MPPPKQLAFPKALSRLRLPAFFAGFFPYALIGVLVLIMFWPSLSHRMVSGDHAMHFAKAWFLEKYLIPQGHLHGWSERILIGYPTNYQYPFLGDLLVVLVHSLSFGWMTLSQAYGITVCLAYATMGWAVYFAGARMLGPATALIAAVLYLTDRGGHPSGGWNGTIGMGVWPCALSVALSTIGFSYLLELFFDGEPRDLTTQTKLAAWLGLCLIAHPAQVFVWAIYLLTVVVYSGFVLPWRQLRRALLRLGPCLLVGGGIGSFWLLPFLSTTGYSQPGGGRWMSLLEMGRRLVTGGLFPGKPYIATLAGFVGIWLLILGRDRKRALVGYLPVAFLVLGCSELTEGPFRALFPKHIRFVEFRRFALFLKPYWFLAAGYLICVLSRRALVLLRRKGEISRYSACIFVLCVVPLVAVGSRSFFNHQVMRPFQLDTDPFYTEVRPKLLSWLKEKRDADPRFWRIGVDFGRDDHRLFDLITDLGQPVYKIGWTPSLMFRFSVGKLEAKELRAANVRYVISKNVIDDPAFEPVYRVGPATLYEFHQWQPERYDILGSGSVRIASWEDEKIAFDADASARGTLILHSTYFPRWTVKRDGQGVPARPEFVEGLENSPFLSFELKPGHYDVTFETGWTEALGSLLFWISIFVLLAWTWVTKNRDLVASGCK